MTSEPIQFWQKADRIPPLREGEVHVWHVRLMPPSPEMSALLSEDEHDRARRFHFERDRDRFVTCRARLRTFLGQYTTQSPAELRFAYGPQGKPALMQPAGQSEICFNVSHTGDAALLAFARDRQVGVDIESLTTVVDYLALAERFMSARESAYIRAASDIPRAFYACWTRKEAWLKAMGHGLNDSLARFDVSSSFQEMPAILTSDESRDVNWTLYELLPAEGLIGALVLEGSVGNLRCFRDDQLAR